MIISDTIQGMLITGYSSGLLTKGINTTKVIIPEVKNIANELKKDKVNINNVKKPMNTIFNSLSSFNILNIDNEHPI